MRPYRSNNFALAGKTSLVVKQTSLHSNFTFAAAKTSLNSNLCPQTRQKGRRFLKSSSFFFCQLTYSIKTEKLGTQRFVSKVVQSSRAFCAITFSLAESRAQRKSNKKKSSFKRFRSLRRARRATCPPPRKLLKKLDQNFSATDELRCRLLKLERNLAVLKRKARRKRLAVL